MSQTLIVGSCTREDIMVLDFYGSSSSSSNTSSSSNSSSSSISSSSSSSRSCGGISILTILFSCLLRFVKFFFN